MTGTSGRQREGLGTWRWAPHPPEDETLEERLDRMQGEIFAGRDQGLDTRDALAAQRGTLKRVEAGAAMQVAAVKAELTRKSRDQAIEGIRRAALGGAHWRRFVSPSHRVSCQSRAAHLSSTSRRSSITDTVPSSSSDKPVGFLSRHLSRMSHHEVARCGSSATARHLGARLGTAPCGYGSEGWGSNPYRRADHAAGSNPLTCGFVFLGLLHKLVRRRNAHLLLARQMIPLA